MKKILIFLLICCGISFTGCSAFDVSVDVEILGYGVVSQDLITDTYYVKIGSEQYPIDKIYVSICENDGENTMLPIEGMKVTCFRIVGETKVKFMAGELSKDYIEEYFAYNDTLRFILNLVVILGLIYCGYRVWRLSRIGRISK